MSVFGLSEHPVLTLTPVSKSFPFQSKYIYFIPSPTDPSCSTIAPLGSCNPPSPPPSTPEPRQCTSTNGFFKDHNHLWPLSLEWDHAQVWHEDGSVWIRANATKYGTFVNDEYLAAGALRRLRKGDILTLGDNVPPQEGMVPNDLRLQPITASIGLIGVRNATW